MKRFPFPLRAACALLALALIATGAPIAAAQESELREDEIVVREEDDGRKTFSFGVTGSAWLAEIDGEVRIPRGDLFGTDIELSGDLDFEDPFLLPAVEAFLTTRFISIYADYFRLDADEEVTLDSTLRFAGREFQAGRRVEADFTIESAAARLVITPLSFDLFELGVVAGARYYRVEGTLRDEIGPFAIEASDEIEAPIPFVGLTGRVFISVLELYGTVQGVSLTIDYDGTEYDIQYVEADVGAAINIGEHFAILGGFRGIFLDLEETEDDDQSTSRERTNIYEIEQLGPYLAIRLRF